LEYGGVDDGGWQGGERQEGATQRGTYGLDVQVFHLLDVSGTNCKIEVLPATAKKQSAGRCDVATVCALVVVAKGKKKGLCEIGNSSMSADHR
jgi:hypothetical protein